MASSLPLLTLTVLLVTCCLATTSEPQKAPWETPCEGQGEGHGAEATPPKELEGLRSASLQALNLTLALSKGAKTLGSWMTSAHFDNFPVARDWSRTSSDWNEVKSEVRREHYRALSNLSPFLELLQEQSALCAKMAEQCRGLQSAVLAWLCRLTPHLNPLPSAAPRSLVTNSLRALYDPQLCDVRDAILVKDTLALVEAFHWQYGHVTASTE